MLCMKDASSNVSFLFFSNVDALCDDYFEQNCESWFTVAHVAKGSS